jgi:hypothetical protein
MNNYFNTTNMAKGLLHPAPKPKPQPRWDTREGFSNGLDKVRGAVMSPIGLGVGLGLAGAGLGYGLWRNIVQTGGSLGRIPIRKMTGMSDEEYDQAMEELASDKRYKWIIPGALATLLGGGYLAIRANPNQKHYGLTSWSPKTASLHKEADELWSYGGYVPDIDFSQVINANSAKSMFTNDPAINKDPYVMNTGVAIINSASNKAGYSNPTLGNIYDSTSEKMKKKLSWAGVTDVAANTMLANATAHLFTSALGAVMPLSDDMKRNIIDAGTWAAAITSILK